VDASLNEIMRKTRVVPSYPKDHEYYEKRYRNLLAGLHPCHRLRPPHPVQCGNVHFTLSSVCGVDWTDPVVRKPSNRGQVH
jgi:hypothetical protein